MKWLHPIYVRIIKMRTERAGAEAMQIALFCTYVAIFISYRLHKEVEDAEKEYSARQREVYIIIHLYFNIHVRTYMHSDYAVMVLLCDINITSNKLSQASDSIIRLNQTAQNANYTQLDKHTNNCGYLYMYNHKY